MAKQIRNEITVVRAKNVDTEELTRIVEKRIISKKTKFGVVLKSMQGNFSESDVKKIAEILEMNYNGGSCIR